MFSSPIGESTFSTERKQNVNLDRRPRFRPLSGNLLSLQQLQGFISFFDVEFSSPIGESTFSTKQKKLKVWKESVFVPYRGIYFLYDGVLKCITDVYYRFRPLSGNLLSLQGRMHDVRCGSGKVFVPYRGIYFLYEIRKYSGLTQDGFRPLSGNLLSLQKNMVRTKIVKFQFSSPIGESTFSTTVEEIKTVLNEKWFSSPIGESTFSTRTNHEQSENEIVFVPYRGIYFLYMSNGYVRKNATYSFRPLSGNLLSLRSFTFL